MIGQRFGMLTVTERAGTSTSGNILWWSDCDCGNTTRSAGSDLRTRSRSCGCQNKRPRTGEAHRLWTNIDHTEPDECWLWTAALDENGYGRIRRDSGVRVSAQRLAWILTNGPVPDGLVLDHLCRNRACCNPKHLQPVTHQTNLLRGDTHAARNAAKTHCLRGHEFTEANTYIDGRGGRSCRECRKFHKKQARIRRLQASQTQE